MEDFRDEEILDKPYDRQLMTRLLTYARPYWAVLLFCVLLVMISAGVDLLGPYLTEIAIDQYLTPGINSPEAQRGLLRLAGLLAAGYAAGFVAGYGQIQLLQWTGQRIIFRIRQDVFHHLQQLHLQFFDTTPVGRLVTRVTNDTENLNELYTSVLVNLFRDVFMLIGITVVMFRTNVRLALVSLALVIPMGYCTFYFMRKARDAWREVRTRLARINAFLSEQISGMKIIQLFAREAETFREFKVENDGYFQASWAQLMVWAVFRPVLTVLANVGLALVLWYGGVRALGGDISVGVLYLFVTLTRQFFDPLMSLAEKFNILESAMASAEKLFRLLDTPPAIVDPPHPVPLGRVRGEVEFRHVWFAYEGEDWVLKDVSFKARPGQTIAFVGHTGAGKSSIISLLTRFYDIQKGEILIDGINIKDVAQADLRRNVGLVAQDVFLFTGDIKSNIRLGNTAISDEAVRDAAVAAEADPFIRALPYGYNEPVVERGATLSAGQRQLISFARALAFDPAILVLDEATASIDSETEAAIQRALARLTRGRTTFIIAHRLATIQHADQILVLHKGRIREQGTHAELLAKRGLYYKLWRLQFAENQEQEAEMARPEPGVAGS